MTAVNTLLVLVIYVALPFGMHEAGLGQPFDMALELMAMMILLLAARLAIAIADSALLVFLPIAFLAGLSSQMLVLETGLAAPYDVIIGSVAAILIGFGCQMLVLKLTSNWRHAARTGFSLTFGVLALAVAAPMLPMLEPVEHPLELLPAGIALMVTLLLQITISKSAGQTALQAAARDKSWGDTLGIPIEPICQQMLLITGILAGLAAIPLFSAEIVQSPDRWPVFWLGIAAIVILTGHQPLADMLWLALFVLVLPRLVNLWLPDLPDMVLPAVILAIVVATLSHRGARPGDMPASHHEQPGR